MKKIFSLILSIALAFSFVSCGAEDSSDTSSVQTDALQSDTVTSEVESTVSSEGESSTVESEVETEIELVPPMPTNDYSKNTFNIVDYKNYYKLEGRYAELTTSADLGAEKAISFDNTAQLLAFNADCEGDVTLSVTVKPKNGAPMNNCYFSVYVDGAETRMKVDGVIGMETKHTITLATGLSKGRHEFEVYRDTEFLLGTANVISVTVNGVLVEPPAKKELYIEFIGDSITAGYGNLTLRELSESDAHGPEKSDGTETYAFIAAQKLNADFSMVARSGLAFSYHDIEAYWNRISYSRENLGNYTPSRYPDVVVISLGTNDHSNYANEGLTLDQVREKAEALIKLVRAARPNAKIVWAYGMMGTKINYIIQHATINCGGEKEGIYYFEGQANSDGGGWHPSKLAHSKNGQLLADYISNILK